MTGDQDPRDHQAEVASGEPSDEHPLVATIVTGECPHYDFSKAWHVTFFNPVAALHRHEPPQR
jgi:hypothetical protein